MTKEELIAVIDKVIGGKGIMRAPAWWVRRIFGNLMDYTDGKAKEVKSYTDEAVKNVKITVDSEMSGESENAVSNKVIKKYVDDAVSKVGVEVVDNLESESTTAALSANQGRVLAERIGDIDSILDSINGEII